MVLEIHHVRLLKLIFLITPSYIQGVEHQQLRMKSRIILWFIFTNLYFTEPQANEVKNCLGYYMYIKTKTIFPNLSILSGWYTYRTQDLMMGETWAAYIFIRYSSVENVSVKVSERCLGEIPHIPNRLPLLMIWYVLNFSKRVMCLILSYCVKLKIKLLLLATTLLYRRFIGYRKVPWVYNLKCIFFQEIFPFLTHKRETLKKYQLFFPEPKINPFPRPLNV